MSSPCHIELILSEKEEPVKKEVCGHVVVYTVALDYLIQCMGLMLCYCGQSFPFQAESQIATRKA
jgi:hypothetical protein